MEYNYLIDNLLILIIFIIPLIAQIKVSINYNKYLKEDAFCGLTGFEVARKILDSHGLNNIHIVENDISYVHYVERKGNTSVLYNMPINQFKEERQKTLESK